MAKVKIVIPKKTLKASFVPVCLIIPLYEPITKKLIEAIIPTSIICGIKIEVSKLKLISNLIEYAKTNEKQTSKISITKTTHFEAYLLSACKKKFLIIILKNILTRNYKIILNRNYDSFKIIFY